MLTLKSTLNKSNNLTLLDIFSYSCVNCQRSLEFIKKLDRKYKAYGLNTILMHSPEWNFEKNINNVFYALKKLRLKLPLILDNNKQRIKKFKVNFWPTQILIKNNKVLYKHIGEGNYKELEENIQSVLKIRTNKIFDKEPIYSKFPTIYLGKRKRFGKVYINGKWIQKDEYLQHTGKKGSLTILTKGKIISFVAKSINNKAIKVNIKLNNKQVKNLTINKPQLYTIIKLKNNKPKKLSLITKSKLVVYSFSFQ